MNKANFALCQAFLAVFIYLRMFTLIVGQCPKVEFPSMNTTEYSATIGLNLTLSFVLKMDNCPELKQSISLTISKKTENEDFFTDFCKILMMENSSCVSYSVSCPCPDDRVHYTLTKTVDMSDSARWVWRTKEEELTYLNVLVTGKPKLESLHLLSHKSQKALSDDRVRPSTPVDVVCIHFPNSSTQTDQTERSTSGNWSSEPIINNTNIDKTVDDKAVPGIVIGIVLAVFAIIIIISVIIIVVMVRQCKPPCSHRTATKLEIGYDTVLYISGSEDYDCVRLGGTQSQIKDRILQKAELGSVAMASPNLKGRVTELASHEQQPRLGLWNRTVM